MTCISSYACRDPHTLAFGQAQARPSADSFTTTVSEGTLWPMTVPSPTGVVTAAPSTAIACLFVYQILTGVSSPGVYAIGQTLAGPRAAGRWIGVQNMMGNVAGIAAPVITGILVDSTGSFLAAFSLAAAVNALGFIGWVIMIARVAPLAWQGRTAAARAESQVA